MKRFAKWQWLLVFLASSVLVAAKPRSDSEDLHLKLVWRQQIGPSRVPPHSIFSKPAIINPDFVVRNVITNGQLLIFDANGLFAGTLPTNPEATLNFSPTNTASVLTELKTDVIPPGTDDAPSALTGFVTSKQAWLRSSFASSTNLVNDSGVSVELNEFIEEVRFFDGNGNLIRDLFPFGSALPWSEERPAFSTFSGDGSTFALLATTSDSLSDQTVKLFLYDQTGKLKHSVDLPQLKLAQGVGLSAAGTSALVIGWTDNPVISPQAAVMILVIDEAGGVSQQFTVSSVGFQVLVRPDTTTGEFAVDTGDGTIIITGSQTPPSFFQLSASGFNTVAANSGLTVVLSLIPKNKDGSGQGGADDRDEESEMEIQILNHGGALLLDRKLEGNTHGLVTPFVRFSKDGQFIAVQFSDEIRYYQLEKEGD